MNKYRSIIELITKNTLFVRKETDRFITIFCSLKAITKFGTGTVFMQVNRIFILHLNIYML